MSDFQSLLDSPVRIDGNGVNHVVRENHNGNWNAGECADIDVSTGKAALMYIGDVPWHKGGTQLAELATSDEALEHGQLKDWRLSAKRLSYDHDGASHWTDNRAIVRQDTGACLGVVGARYEIFTNEMLAELADEGLRSVGGKFVTAGALGKGERVWLLASLKDCECDIVPGDAVQSYVMFQSSHDGSSAINIFPTNVRVVCNNTYTMACRSSKDGLSFRHTANASDRAKAMIAELRRSKEITQEFTQLAGQLATTPLNNPKGYFNAVLDDYLSVKVEGIQLTGEAIRKNSCFDDLLTKDISKDRRESAEKSMKRAIKRRDSIFADLCERYDSERCNGMAAIKNTAWAAWNAVTEHADHSDLRRFRGDEQARADSRFTSVMSGDAAALKRAGFDALEKVQ